MCLSILCPKYSILHWWTSVTTSELKCVFIYRQFCTGESYSDSILCKLKYGMAHYFNAEIWPSLSSQQLCGAIGPVSTSVSQLMRTIPIQSHINPQTCTTSDLRAVNVVTVARAHHFIAANLVVQPYIILTFHV